SAGTNQSKDCPIARATRALHIGRSVGSAAARVREHTSHRCAADERYEFASFHSITSSARAMRVGGMSMPSARAVERLITNSNLLDWTTGRSAGLAPWRIRTV